MVERDETGRFASTSYPEVFRRRIGPLPVWAWSLSGAIGIGVYLFIRRRRVGPGLLSGGQVPDSGATGSGSSSGGGTVGGGGGSAGGGTNGGGAPANTECTTSGYDLNGYYDCVNGAKVRPNGMPNCMAGERWDGVAGKCVPINTPQQCPSGQYWDDTLQRCRVNNPVGQPGGQCGNDTPTTGPMINGRAVIWCQRADGTIYSKGSY